MEELFHIFREAGQGGRMMSSCATAAPTTDRHEVDDLLLEPFRYLQQVPGKNVRGQLIDAFQVWLSIPADVVVVIKRVVEYLHNASLLIDDIEDNSLLRRGRAVAHTIYGIPNTLNCANYIYFMALEDCQTLNNPAALAVFTGELLNLHRGQGRDILWRDSGRCPTEDEYVAMVLDKTGGLFRLAVKLMLCFSDRTQDYVPLVNMMGIYFQVRDDLINLASPKYQEGKSFAEDLSEGKFSLPIIHCVHARPEDTRVLSILKQRTQSREVNALH